MPWPEWSRLDARAADTIRALLRDGRAQEGFALSDRWLDGFASADDFRAWCAGIRAD